MKLAGMVVIAAALAFVIDFGIGKLALRWTGVPADFPPFTFLPVLSGTIGGVVFASLVYTALRLTARNPDRSFFFVTLAVFALSLLLPLRLSFTRSSRFKGVTPSAQMTLVLMHAVVATVAITALTTRPE